MDSLIEKLMVSKKIMDRHNEMDRGVAPKSNRPSMSESYSHDEYDEKPIPVNYNIPEEYLTSAPPVPKTPPVVTEDRIKNSKLPDAIKKLMIEHPIQQPQSYAPTLSDDIIEKASRLMGNKQPVSESSQTSRQPKQQNVSFNLSAEDIKKIVRETVEEVLTENGLMIESTQKSNEVMTIKVGKHIFEGKISKIKKVQ
jgi:hypothetical protein